MTRYLGFGLVVGALATIVLLQLTQTAELIAWEIILVLLLIILVRLFPRSPKPGFPSLFGGSREESPHAPRSVATFELAAVHAFSGSIGSDRRMRSQMRRIASHRLRRRGVRPDSPRAAQWVDPILFEESLQPLTATQIERIVDQMEKL